MVHSCLFAFQMVFAGGLLVGLGSLSGGKAEDGTYGIERAETVSSLQQQRGPVLGLSMLF
ncbi:hypothetical protein [Novosphingobium sp.]|jgi:hypothetical protein|uniref:hypothetical protein n=1 Tax=Novosphingobium sp. TaxID=1874826 RepID=UPI002FE13F6C